MPRFYGKQDIILLPNAEHSMGDEDISEENILKVFNDPDHRNDEKDPQTIERFFNSDTNPRTIRISYHKGHSLQYAHNLFTNAAYVVVESITVEKPSR